MANEISQRRVVGFVLLAFAALIGVLAFGSLMASCQGDVGQPSAGVASPSPPGVAAPSSSSGTSPAASADGSPVPSPSGAASLSPGGTILPTIVLPTRPPGDGDGPEPTIHIPPPIH
jgi:hypothetical protein